MIARSVTLTEAKAKLSELLDAVERGEEIIIVRHGERIARLRAYTAAEDAPHEPRSPAERVRRVREACAGDRALIAEVLRRERRPTTVSELKRLAREGLGGEVADGAGVESAGRRGSKGRLGSKARPPTRGRGKGGGR
jgi:prevent-host-death family protein